MLSCAEIVAISCPREIISREHALSSLAVNMTPFFTFKQALLSLKGWYETLLRFTEQTSYTATITGSSKTTLSGDTGVRIRNDDGRDDDCPMCRLWLSERWPPDLAPGWLGEAASCQPASEKSPFSEGSPLSTIQRTSMAHSFFISLPKLRTNGLACITFAHYWTL